MNRREQMSDLTGKTVQKASSEEVFQALAYAALKARAGRIAPNQIIKTGKYEMLVAEDENGYGLVVQIILPIQQMEEMALAKARELDCTVEDWSDHVRLEWLAGFWRELSAYLERWQHIKMLRGPGENITFERAVSR
jgi:hypothetical protein